MDRVKKYGNLVVQSSMIEVYKYIILLYRSAVADFGGYHSILNKNAFRFLLPNLI